jgi:hypothetical protein
MWKIFLQGGILSATGEALRVTPPVLSILPCILKWKWKLDKEKSKHTGLAQQNSLGPALLHTLLKACKRHSKP